MLGKLINFEGIDSSGKQTQTGLLVNRLIKEGKKVETYKFPTDDTLLGLDVQRYLAKEYGSKEEVGPYVGALFYTMDRYQFLEEFNKELESGINLILDRYTPSNIFQSAKFETMEDRIKHWGWVKDVERFLPKQDAIVFLDVLSEVSQKHFSKREAKNPLLEKGQKDIHEVDTEYQKEVRKTYLEVAKRDENWIVINCCEKRDGENQFRNPNEIHADIYTELKGINVV